MKRRHFLKATLAGTVAAALPNIPRAAFAGQGSAGQGAATLDIVSRTLNVNGRAATVYGLVGADGKSGLTLEAGTDFDVLLRNRLAEETLVHWHGLTPPWPMDGVPSLPTSALKAKEERAYRFPIGKGGTHWMHAHSLQEQNLLAAPIIVRDGADKAADEQEVVVMLHDFSFTPAGELLAKLKGSGAATVNSNGMQGMDHSGMKAGSAMSGHAGMSGMSGMTGMGNMGGNAHGGMAMGNMDINDIDYDAYLANDRTLDDPEIVKVERGGMVRLRIINGATATGFTIDLGALEGTLIAVDGQLVEPVAGRTVPLSMGQRADIRVRIPAGGGAFPILALREGARERTGLILALAGAAVSRVAPSGETAGAVLDLELETKLRAKTPLSQKPADRSFEIGLTGTMTGYEWAMPGADAIRVKEGERIEITMRNMSMMAHPMHLHGHHFQIVAIDGQRLAGAMRDTVLVPPMRSVTFAVDANNRGRWAFHCHHLYHMASGMMAEFAYEGA